MARQKTTTTKKVKIDPSANKPDQISILSPGIIDNSTLSGKTETMTPDKKPLKGKKNHTSENCLRFIIGVNIMIRKNKIHMTSNQAKMVKILIQHFLMRVKTL